MGKCVARAVLAGSRTFSSGGGGRLADGKIDQDLLAIRIDVYHPSRVGEFKQLILKFKCVGGDTPDEFADVRGEIGGVGNSRIVGALCVGIDDVADLVREQVI